MFPECRLLHKELNVFNCMAVGETCVIIVAKIIWNSQTIVTHFARFRKVNAHRDGHFVQPFEYSVGQSEVADSCHCKDPEELVDTTSAQVVLGAPVR